MLLPLLVATAANLGTNVHLPPTDTLDLAADLGGQWIRIDLNWDLAEPAQGQFNWQPFDAVIDAAVERGLSVYATLGYTPAWASTGDRQGDGARNDVPDAAAYRAFVEAAVARYHDRVGVFGTWNEPNLGDFFEGTRDEWIANVYRPAVLGIRAQCASCTVAGPEVATIGNAYDDFIVAALAAEVPDILSAHIYASFPEDDAGAGVTKDSFYNKLEAHRTIGGISIGEPSIRESMIAAGQDLPIWITETGRQAAMTSTNDLEAQRQYVERLLDAMDARPWWAGTILYELSEEHPGGMWPDIHWGLALRVHDPDGTPLDDFTPKPAYDYLKMRLAQAGSGGDAGGGGGGGPTGTTDAGVPTGGGGDAGMPDGAEPGAGCGCHTTGGGLEWMSALGVLLVLRRRRPR